eukprot:GFUD01079230.1.p1 GENE.GFUD01079230.1~~GFUD01079230.1.p1  ORF type:complete len:179 (+),score=34.48 GFUD01079230.1:76-612(+)
MEGMKKRHFFTILVTCLTPSITLGKFRVNMLARPEHNEDLLHTFNDRDASEDHYEIEYPPQPENVGKYIRREKHFPFNNDLLDADQYPVDQQHSILDILKCQMNKELKKKYLEYIPYQAQPTLTTDQLHKNPTVTFRKYSEPSAKLGRQGNGRTKEGMAEVVLRPDMFINPRHKLLHH